MHWRRTVALTRRSTVNWAWTQSASLRELQRAILVQDAALDDGTRQIGSTLERAAAILPKSARERAESLYEYGVALIRTGDVQRAGSTLAAAERLAGEAGERGIEERARLYRTYLSVLTEGKSPLEHLADTERAATRFEGTATTTVYGWRSLSRRRCSGWSVAARLRSPSPSAARTWQRRPATRGSRRARRTRLRSSWPTALSLWPTPSRAVKRCSTLRIGMPFPPSASGARSSLCMPKREGSTTHANSPTMRSPLRDEPDKSW